MLAGQQQPSWSSLSGGGTKTLFLINIFFFLDGSQILLRPNIPKEIMCIHETPSCRIWQCFFRFSQSVFLDEVFTVCICWWIFHSLYFLMKFLQSVFVDGFFTVCISWWSLPNTDSLSSGPQAQATHSWKLGRWAQTYFRCLLNITRTDICMYRLAKSSKSHEFCAKKAFLNNIFSTQT